MNSLLARKLLVAFLVGFGGVFIPAALTLLDKVASGTPSGVGKDLVISLVSGAFAAGVRALLAFSPVNLVPSDAEHSLTKK